MSAEDDTWADEPAPAADAAAAYFLGLSHAEVLDLEFGDEPPDLIEDLVPRGVVVTTAGLPETYKGWLCAKKADVIARGTGEVLGCRGLAQGNVGYFWQDDSTRNEAERVQLYARVHDTPRDLPVRWFLNEGLRLPRDLDQLRETIETYQLIYVIVDSFYNVATDLDLKERDAGIVFSLIKTDVCDHTGCTVDIVDHMPWATDVNRKRLRGYGDVFKNAAVRAGLYIDADGSKLYVEARGNNIRGIKRTPAYWDADALELRLIETSPEDTDLLDADIEAYVEQHPGQATTQIAAALEKRLERVRKALNRLSDPGRLSPLIRKTARDLGHSGTGHYWLPHGYKEPEPSQLFGTAQTSHPNPTGRLGTAQPSNQHGYAETEPSQPHGTARDGSDAGPNKEAEPSRTSAEASPRRGDVRDGSADGSPASAEDKLPTERAWL